MIDTRLRIMVKQWSQFITETVFYLPILGPVYFTENLIDKLLWEILENSQSDNFLCYDKNKRWQSRKTENIILEEIYYNDDRVIIPVKDGVKNILKLFFYSTKEVNDDIMLEIKNNYSTLISQFSRCILYSFKSPQTKEHFKTHNIFLKRLSDRDQLDLEYDNVINFYKLDKKIQPSFNDLGYEPEMAGFGFLWKNFLSKERKIGPVFCVIENKKIVGAIGPLEIMNDFQGRYYLPPPYFGVKENCRVSGYGGLLWQTAMSWAYSHGAQYTMEQNIPDSPATNFYKKQGLSIGGHVYSFDI